MKLVFTAKDVAAALEMTIAEFAALRPVLEDLDFPRPLVGLGERWSIMDVMNWIHQNSGSSRMIAPGNSRLLPS